MLLHPARTAVLKTHKRSQSEPTISIDAIIFQNVRVPEEDLYDDDVHKWCKSAIATSASEATVDHSIDPPRWGNPQGLSALEKIDLLTSDVKSLKDQTNNLNTEVANLNTEVANLNTEIVNLNTKVNILAPESASYLAIRDRFFSTYRRDILVSVNSKDRDAVPLGNKKAHGGDVITDRRLYENGTRFDDETFQDLYGIHWARVHQIENDVAITNALNSHASAVANRDYLREHLTPLNTAFNKLIQLMKENQFRSFAHLRNAPETIAMAEYNKENQALINQYRGASA